MNSPALVAAAQVKPPREGEIVVTAVTSTSAAVAIPAAWYGRWVTFQATDQDVFTVFGDSGVVASDTATSGDTRAAMVPSAGEKSWYIGRELINVVTHYAVKTASTGTNLRAFPS